MSQVQNGAALPHGYVLNGEKQSYVIEKAIGQGAFGITYLAKYKAQIQGQMGRGSAWVQVAVKEFFMREFNRRDEQTLSLNESSDASIVDKYRRAFMREARNLAKMHHDNIVNVFEVIETNNTAYIVMEFLDGGNLDEYIVGKGRLSEDEALRLFEPVCDAVCYMHAKKMLHLDVKPKNIMLDEEGHVYLIDFGLSKQYASNGEPESSTSIGLGTPGYAPSEQADQADGSKDFQRTLDIYALGATMYKMLTGQTPPKATEVTASMLDGSDMIKSDLRSIGVSPSVASVVSKAMYPSRKKRYQTVEELMGAFGWKPNKYAFEEPETPISGGQSAIGSKADAEEETVAAGSDITVPTPSGKKSGWLKWFLIGLAAVVVLSLLARGCGSDIQTPEPIPVEEIADSLANTSDNFTNLQSQSGQAQSASAAERPASEQPATQPVEPKTGSLKLTSTPSGAAIWIDGRNTGKKTPDLIEDLTVGGHKVVLKLTDFEDLSQSITISADSRAERTLTLKEKVVASKYGSCRIDSTPSGASIWIDGMNTGKKTPSTLEDLTPGEHKVQLELTDYDDISQDITILADSLTECIFTLKEKEKLVALAASGTINGYEYVDLGLSVKWATCNVGSTSPEGFGNCFAWGETSPKNDYTFKNLKYCIEGDDVNAKFSKYVTDSKYGPVDNKTVLDPSDDAARVNWGGSWRMPTKYEFEELISNCTSECRTLNGVLGRVFTSKKNGNRIFLPIPKYISGHIIPSSSGAHYWSSSLCYEGYLDYPYDSYEFFFDEGSPFVTSGYRKDGFYVRPVSE